MSCYHIFFVRVTTISLDKDVNVETQRKRLYIMIHLSVKQFLSNKPLKGKKK